MSLNKLDKEILKQIATDKSQGGRYYAFERLLEIFGRWSRDNVYPKGLTSLCKDDRARKAIFTGPVDVFLLIDSLLVRYKLDPAYKTQFLAFDLQFLTSAGAETIRYAKASKLTRLLNSYPCQFLQDYVKAYTAMVELIRLDLLKEL